MTLERPTAPRRIANTGVKQHSAQITVPIIPVFKIPDFILLITLCRLIFSYLLCQLLHSDIPKTEFAQLLGELK